MKTMKRELKRPLVAEMVEKIAREIHAETTSKYKHDLVLALKDFNSTPLGRAIHHVNEELPQGVSKSLIIDHVKDRYKLVDPNLVPLGKTKARVLQHAIHVVDSGIIENITHLKSELRRYFMH